MHNSLPVMCVLNATEIYMAAYANLAMLSHAVLAKQTTREKHATQTAPSGHRQFVVQYVTACVCVLMEC